MRKIISIILSTLVLQACSLSNSIPATDAPPTDELTITPTASITPTITVTPTFTTTPELFRTPFVESDFPTQTLFVLPGVKAPTLIATATPSVPGGGFDSIKLTQTKLYWGHCDKPGSTKMTITVQEPEKVDKVYLFFRLKSMKKDDTTPWVGTITDNDGGGVFLYTLRANNIPDKNQYPKAWIQYQFVSEDKDKNIVGRTQIYLENISLYPCL